MALAGVAAAGTISPTVVAFGNSDTSALKAAHPFITDAFYVHGTSNPSITLSNGDVISFSTEGATYAGGTDGSVEKTWANSAAITEMNAALGLTSGFTGADFSEEGIPHPPGPGCTPRKVRRYPVRQPPDPVLPGRC